MTTKPRCVLVDDDQDFRSFAHQVLNMNYPDFDVIEFLDGMEALEFLAQNHVELIITDFRMPLLDGLRLTSAVRVFDVDVPILVMSGDAVGNEALARGASAFLPKCEFASLLSSALERVGLHMHAA